MTSTATPAAESGLPDAEMERFTRALSALSSNQLNRTLLLAITILREADTENLQDFSRSLPAEIPDDAPYLPLDEEILDLASRIGVVVNDARERICWGKLCLEVYALGEPNRTEVLKSLIRQRIAS